MAMQWIKMRVDLQTNPKVVRIMSALNADKFRVIGGLHAVWSVFDAHSEDGRLDGYSFDLMDSIVGWPGLSNAMASAGWLRQDGQVLVAPDFIEHNGRTAKRRAMETQRKSEARKTSASDADKKRTREEKRREEVNSYQELRASTDLGDSTPAERVCARLKTLGITGANPTRPELLKLLADGVPESEILAVGEEEKSRGKGMAWVIAVVIGRRAEAVAQQSAGVTVVRKIESCCFPGCSGKVSGTVSGRPWCREHQDYAMDNANFRRAAA